MDILKTTKFKRLVPVKLIGNKLVKLKDLSLDQKEPKKSKYDTKTLETSYSTNSYKSTNSNIHNVKLIRNLSAKYEKLMEGLKNGTEIVGTVEENKNAFPTRNPFSFKTNLNHHNYISKTKKVLFKKQDKNQCVLKIIDSNLYMTIFNKTQPPKRIYTRNDIKKIIKIQKEFKGFAVREVEQKVRNLKVNYCVLEALCLLIGHSFDSAKKRIMFQRIKNKYHDSFMINDEIYFKDKLEFKLPNRYYNILDIQQLDLPSKNKKMPVIPVIPVIPINKRNKSNNIKTKKII